MNRIELAEQVSKALTECDIDCDGPHIVVLHRGWIFKGNLRFNEEDGKYVLVDACNVRKWSSGGFGGLTQGAKSSQATLDKCNPLQFDPAAMIFCVPVESDWENK